MSADDIGPPAPGGPPPLLEERDILDSLGERRGPCLFLGRYSVAEVQAVMARRGFFREARKRGLWPVVFDLDSAAYPLQRLRIFHGRVDPDRVIVDLKIREGAFPGRPAAGGVPALRPFSALVFEWLTLQNPLACFPDDRSALPGQRRPGLSLSPRIIDIFSYLGALTGKDALLAFPAYYHNAVLFSRYFRFLDPDKQAEVEAVHRALGRLPIRRMAWLVHLGCLRTADGAVYEWRSAEQARPLARDLKDYFESKAYRERVKEVSRRLSFRVAWDDFESKAQLD